MRPMPVTLTRDGAVAILTLDRPERRNALAGPDWHAVRDLCRSIPDDVRAVIVTGAGEHFCAGMDLSPQNPLMVRMAGALANGDEAPARALLDDLKDCVGALAELPMPTFAAIEGACVGGGLEIALACDVRIASRSAKLSLPEVHIGMIPDVGGCARLTRLVGPGRAADLIVTGRRIDGGEAWALGVVERLVEPGDTFAVALEAARQVSSNGPTAVRMALNVVRLAGDLGLAEALSIETRAGVLAMTSGEARIGVQAFLEKRPPKWS